MNNFFEYIRRIEITRVQLIYSLSLLIAQAIRKKEMMRGIISGHHLRCDENMNFNQSPKILTMEIHYLFIRQFLSPLCPLVLNFSVLPTTGFPQKHQQHANCFH